MGAYLVGGEGFFKIFVGASEKKWRVFSQVQTYVFGEKLCSKKHKYILGKFKTPQTELRGFGVLYSHHYLR